MQLCSKPNPDSETGRLLTGVDPQHSAAWKISCVLACCLPRYICNAGSFVRLPFALSPLPQVPPKYHCASNRELVKVLRMQQLLLLIFALGKYKPILVTPTFIIRLQISAAA